MAHSNFSPTSTADITTDLIPVRQIKHMLHLTGCVFRSSSRSRCLAQMAAPLSTLHDLPKSHTFTSKLPPDPDFPTPQASHKASREDLSPRPVIGGLFTYVRPEPQGKRELLAVSPAALRDVGLKEGEEQTEDFKALVAGEKIIGWDETTGEGPYPWAQCYGG